jgi:hypothetical protein
MSGPSGNKPSTVNRLIPRHNETIVAAQSTQQPYQGYKRTETCNQQRELDQQRRELDQQQRELDNTLLKL